MNAPEQTDVTPRAARKAPHTIEQRAVAHRLDRAVASRDHKRVDVTAHAAQTVINAEQHAARRSHGRPLRGHDLGRVVRSASLAVGRREHLDRADGVEALHVGIRDDHDPAGGHAVILRPLADGGNEEFPSISAIFVRSAFRFRALWFTFATEERRWSN